MKSKFLIIIVLFFVSCNQPKYDKKYVTINQNQSVSEFIEYVSQVTNTKIIMKGKIQEKTHFVVQKPMLKTELIPLLNAILNTHEKVLVEMGRNYYKVVNLSDEGVYVCGYNTKDNNINQTMKTEIFKLDDLNASFVQTKIKPLLTKNAKVIIFKKNNLLAVTAYEATLRSIKMLIEKIKASAKSKFNEEQ